MVNHEHSDHFLPDIHERPRHEDNVLITDNSHMSNMELYQHNDSEEEDDDQRPSERKLGKSQPTNLK